jgi:hypothetical protein
MIATVFKEEKPLVMSKPWKVRIEPCPERGIIGGIMGPWKTKRTAQKWADAFNKIHQ